MRDHGFVTHPAVSRARKPAESRSFAALRVLSACEGVSFALLLVCSVLKRTTGPDLVPVMGSVHGALFLACVALVVVNLRRLRWGWFFTLVMITIGSPGLHFPVVASADRHG